MWSRFYFLLDLYNLRIENTFSVTVFPAGILTQNQIEEQRLHSVDGTTQFLIFFFLALSRT